jgi:hypothetical protein
MSRDKNSIRKVRLFIEELSIELQTVDLHLGKKCYLAIHQVLTCHPDIDSSSVNKVYLLN